MSAHRPHRAPAPRPAVRESRGDGDLSAIVNLLRARTKRDFRGYKRGTLRRRIERRMALQQITGLPAYLAYLRSDASEADQLSKDLLIGVTSFFRDPQAFAELAAKVLAKLVAEREGDDAPIRIWVPGCATGEEAYSLAMLVAEQAAAAQVPCRVQIFGTDIDESALRVARAGLYPESIALDVTPERLRRFFTQEGHNFRIAQSLRESVVFAAQNLVGDPPFSKLDLVSCRNVLIYLDAEMQHRVVSLFHFALLPAGYLFLGSAENPGPAADLFTPVSKRSHIYRRIGLSRRPVVTFPLGDRSAGVLSAQVTASARGELDFGTLTEHELLACLAPSAVLISRTGQIRHFYGRMERYLSLPEGEPNLDVLKLAHEPLKPALRAALHEAVRHDRVATAEAVQVPTATGEMTVRTTVRPVTASPAGEGLLLAIFEEVPSATGTLARRDNRKRRDLVHQLEAELRITKEEQRSLVEQLESGNEELKTANEEVMSMNEELQSTNEELETSKEELQSMNEELSTVNAQLQEKVQELITVNDDLSNLLAATDIATLFVEADLRVKRFTTAATRLFNLIPSDVGRPLSHITNNLIDIDLAGDAEAVLRTLQTSEKEVQARDGHDYIVRVLPYRTTGQVVQGVVVTFSDVTTLKASERRLFNSRRRQAEIARLGQEALAGAAVAALMEQCVHTVAEVLGVELVEVLEDRSETKDLVLRAGVGMNLASPGAPAATASPDSPEGAAYVAHATAVFADLSADVRFAEATLVTQLAMRSGVVVLISMGGEPWGIVGAFSTAAGRLLAPEDVSFLEAMANALGTALTRKRDEEQLTLLNDALELRVAERTKWLTLLHDATRAVTDAGTWDEALHELLVCLCGAENWQIGCVYLPDRQGGDAIVPAVSVRGRSAVPGVPAAVDAQPVRPVREPARCGLHGGPARVDRCAGRSAPAPARPGGGRPAARVASGRRHADPDGPAGDRRPGALLRPAAPAERSTRRPARRRRRPGRACARTRAAHGAGGRDGLAGAAGAGPRAARLAGPGTDRPGPAQRQPGQAVAEDPRARGRYRAADRRRGAAGARSGPAAFTGPVRRRGGGLRTPARARAARVGHRDDVGRCLPRRLRSVGRRGGQAGGDPAVPDRPGGAHECAQTCQTTNDYHRAARGG